MAALAADPNIGGVILKASEGTGTDPAFAGRWAEAGRLGLPRGAYLFERPDLDPIVQADHFLGVVQPVLGDVLIIDCERDGVNVLGHCWTIAQHLHDRTGGWPMVYAGPGLWNTLSPVSTAVEIAAHCPLWQAQYGPTASPMHGWPGGWRLWQYTDHGSVPGAPPCDVSRFAGTRDDFRALGIGTPTMGDDMTEEQAKQLADIAFRVADMHSENYGSGSLAWFDFHVQTQVQVLLSGVAEVIVHGIVAAFPGGAVDADKIAAGVVQRLGALFALAAK